MDFPALITFLSGLALNNDKPWFEEHRPAYEQLRGEWLAFVGQIIDGISRIDPSVGIVSPKDALFRINRDVRFSKDKSPYKTTFSAAICPQGRSSGLPAYYFQVNEAGALFIGGGVWMPEPTILGQIRRHIAEHPEQLSAVLADPAFAATFGTIEGERLKRPPRATTRRRRASSSSSSRASPPASSRRAGWRAGMILRSRSWQHSGPCSH